MRAWAWFLMSLARSRTQARARWAHWNSAERTTRPRRMTAIPGPGSTSMAAPATSRVVPTRKIPPRRTARVSTCSNGSTRAYPLRRRQQGTRGGGQDRISEPEGVPPPRGFPVCSGTSRLDLATQRRRPEHGCRGVLEPQDRDPRARGADRPPAGQAAPPDRVGGRPQPLLPAVLQAGGGAARAERDT